MGLVAGADPADTRSRSVSPREGDPLEIRLLGPLELVQEGHALEVRGASERALLSLLASAPGHAFSKDRLIDELWGEALPANPDNALQLRVSKLRKVVGDALVTAAPGYRLDIEPDAVDAMRFEQLIGRKRFAEALALWRDTPFAEFSEREWARAEAARLTELRATAIEEHVDQRLAASDHVALVAELEGLVAMAPLRERLRGQQMVALYRCGRAAHALAAFQAFRQLLGEDLGVDPSPDLRALEAAILRDDPTLRAPSSPAVASGNVPAPLSSLIGREKLQDRLEQFVATTRLLTLTGPGGVGKTTLATTVVRGVASQFNDGAWFVPLAGVQDGARVPDAIADALGLADPDKASARRLVTAWLAPRRAVLVLDNCEHLADACAVFVEQLLRTASDDLRVIVTSREALGVPGEVQMPVPPLDEDDAIRLFIERARNVSPDVELGQGDEDVRRICERLDGMPLAIELAAARVKTLAPEEIASRLDDRFRLLTLGPRTADARHQTLRATVDWSHDLLDGRQQALFRRLSVFRGGWELSAAESVCGDADVDVLDLLSQLVDRSLVVAGHGRFRMLETIRAYAEERLQEADEQEAMARRHAEFFTRYVEGVEPHLRGPQQARWLGRLRAEGANLRQAMAWAMNRLDDSPEVAVGLGGALGWYWYVGRQTDGRAYLREALAGDREVSNIARGRALQALSLAVRPVGCIVHPTAEGARAAHESSVLFAAAGQPALAAVSQLLVAVEGVAQPDAAEHLAVVEQARTTLRDHADTWGVALADFVEMEIRLHHGRVDEALALGRQAARAFDALDDDWGRSAVMLHLGYGLRVAGRIDEAKEILGQAVLLSREGGLPNNLARSLAELGELELQRGDVEAAEPWLAECETTARDLGNDSLLALAKIAQGGAARLRANAAEATDHYREALVLSAGTEFAKGVTRSRTGLAAAHLDARAVAKARTELATAHELAVQLGDVSIIAAVLEQLSRVAARDGNDADSQRLLCEAEQLRSDHGRPRGVLDCLDVSPDVKQMGR